jgi:hypothetical protein
MTLCTFDGKCNVIFGIAEHIESNWFVRVPNDVVVIAGNDKDVRALQPANIK